MTIVILVDALKTKRRLLEEATLDRLITEIFAADTHDKWGIAYKKSLDFITKCKHPSRHEWESLLKSHLIEAQKAIKPLRGGRIEISIG